MGTSRERRRVETAERVLEAADQLFRTAGFAETTIRDIAESSGVSVGTVMAASDKNALLVAVLDRRIAQLHATRGDRGPADRGAADPWAAGVARVLECFDPFVELFTAHPELARRYGAILVAGDHESVVFTDLARRLVGEIAEALAALDCDEPAAVAEVLYFAYLGRLFTWPSAADRDADALRAALRGLVETACRAGGPRS